MSKAHHWFAPACAAALLFLGGCATLSESQCLANDWETIGYADGANGYDSSRLLEHQDACIKHGVTPSRSHYLAGWEQGVEQFCTPSNGFHQGERGAKYSNVCPSHLEADFRDAYLSGRELHLAASEVSRLENLLRKKRARLEDVNHDIEHTATDLVLGDGSTAERAELLLHTKNLAKEQGELEADIEALTVELALEREYLAELRETLAYSY